MSRRPIAALVAAGLFVLAFATTIVPWLTRERTIVSSTPTSVPRTEVAEVRLRQDEQVCVRGFGLSGDAQALQLIVAKAGRATTPPPLQVEVLAGAYRSTARLEGGYVFNVPVLVALRPPPRELEDVRACVRNLGATVALVGTTTPRELSDVDVRLDERPIETQPSLAFVERRPASVLSRGGEILERVSAFRPFPAHPALLGLLALLVLFGVPAAVVAALALAGRADDPGR